MGNVEMEVRKESNIGPLKQVVRKLITAALSHTVLRSETTDCDHSIDRAKEVLRSGNGLIVIINHFSLKDPPLAVNEVFHNTIMGSKKIIIPIASHMDKRLYHLLGEMTGVTFKPIVTENTMKKGKNNGRKSNDGMMEYLAKSIKILEEGGIVVLAPQGTRMSQLGQPDKSTVGAFMAAAERKSFDRYAFLFIGFGIKGVTDYSKKRGLNLLKKYTANIGACLTSEEILARAGGKFRNVDQVIFEELRKIVPDNYSPIK